MFNRSRAPVQATAPAQDDSWKAQAFINVYMPMNDGTRRKLGVLPLKASKKFDAAVIKRLTEGGEEAVAAMAGKIEFDFRLADADDGVEAEAGF